MKRKAGVGLALFVLLGGLLLFVWERESESQLTISGYDWAPEIIWDGVDLFTAATDTTLSSAIRIGGGQYFGVWLQLVSASATPKVTIEYLCSYDRTAANFAIPDGASAIVSERVAETVYIISVQPVPMPYIKFRVRGITGNATDTTVKLVFFSQPPMSTY